MGEAKTWLSCLHPLLLLLCLSGVHIRKSSADNFVFKGLTRYVYFNESKRSRLVFCIYIYASIYHFHSSIIIVPSLLQILLSRKLAVAIICEHVCCQWNLLVTFIFNFHFLSFLFLSSTQCPRWNHSLSYAGPAFCRLAIPSTILYKGPFIKGKIKDIFIEFKFYIDSSFFQMLWCFLLDSFFVCLFVLCLF